MNFLDQNVVYLAQIGLFSVLSFVFAMVVMPFFIRFLKYHSLGKQIRDLGPDGKETPLFSELHNKKAGTPTMGGVVVWGTAVVMVLLSRLFSYIGWIDHSLINRKETYLPLFALVAVGLLGGVDDWLNIVSKNKHKGIRVTPKLFWLTAFALVGAWWFYFKLGFNAIHVPGVGDFTVGLWYIPIFVIVFIATTNAVNFTDGLDGLAAGLLIFAIGGFGVIAFVKGMMLLATICGVVMGALLAFLWWNVNPAALFMGDTGALSLGAFLGTVALLLDSVLILPIIGLVFVLESLSIIIQLLSKKFLGRKVFLIAPVHHHFEKKGWPETQVVMRFWIVGGVAGVVGTIVGVVCMGVN